MKSYKFKEKRAKNLNIDLLDKARET